MFISDRTRRTETALRLWSTATPLERRFWNKVAIIDDEDSCWEWTAARNLRGYGQFAWKAMDRTGSVRYAHRVAFWLTSPDVLAEAMPEQVCHTCDNPPCVRPKHLFAGDAVINGADKAAKGRARGAPQQGSLNHATVLDEEEALNIRHLAAEGMSHDAIAMLVGVTRPTITYIVQGKTWAHVGGPTERGNRLQKVSKINLADAVLIQERLAAGERAKDLSAEYGITPSRISQIKHGRFLPAQ